MPAHLYVYRLVPDSSEPNSRGGSTTPDRFDDGGVRDDGALTLMIRKFRDQRTRPNAEPIRVTPTDG